MESEHLRASDADREQVVEALRVHAAAGRLTVEELDERGSAALSAVTLGDLRALQADLPALPAVTRPAPSPAHPPPRWPGRNYFAESWRAPATPERAMDDLMRFVAPPLFRHGYHLRERSPHLLRFAKSRRPPWTIAVAILLFPFGLLALLYSEQEEIHIDLHPAEDGTLVTATGVGPLAVRRAFATLEA